MSEKLLTRWGRDLDRNRPLPEYPRPQFARDSFLNLNGVWNYAIRPTSAKQSTIAPRAQQPAALELPEKWDGEIVVPFSPESILSGVERQLGPSETLYYQRDFVVTDAFLRDITYLHFGAVDYQCEVWLGDEFVGSHQGGFLPFSFEITDQIRAGQNQITVIVTDPTDTQSISRGKQSSKPGGIWYTPQSGIWQTVWLESVPADHIQSLRLIPDIDTGELLVQITATDHASLSAKANAHLRIYDGDNLVASAIVPPGDRLVRIPIANPKLWSPEHPHLYQVIVTYQDDEVRSYFGMRKFSLTTDAAGHRRIALNNAPYFHSGLLDQGYWSDGLLTAPSDDALRYDIQQAKALGFNMLRKHIKIEPLRWYYHCDKEGIIVWQDMVNGGSKYYFPVIAALPFIGIRLKDSRPFYHLFGRADAAGRAEYRKELVETVQHLQNVVSLAVWVPFNEGWGQFDSLAAAATVAELDSYESNGQTHPTRLIDHASGWHDQGGSDLISKHIYFRPFRLPRPDHRRAIVLSEFGGYSYPVPNHVYNPDKIFGYKVLKTLSDFQQAFARLFRREILPAIPQGLSATVYTQLSDVEEETNGLLTYDREVLKVDAEATRTLNAKMLRLGAQTSSVK